MEALTARMRLALELLQDAQNLLAAGSLRSAMSRSYYAAYHACIDALERLGFAPEHFRRRDGLPATRWEHGIVWTAFHRAFVVERREIEWRLGVSLRWLFQRRVEADYRPEVDISTERAQEAVRLAEEIVNAAQRLVI
ncbi:MAG: hypothetical protein NZ805_11410 [Armatimonadetes bacterium]|nr:hypothetical protein [Armatimonadota bacterium]MDW8028453.1 hypothetical protein [Armatimonadota bacterium]